MATQAAPPLVQRALAAAEAAGFTKSCAPEMGQLLRTLAATIVNGVIGELGAGYGVGTAWLASGLRADARLVTVELEPEPASAVRALLADEPGATVEQGDWRLALRHAPFALLFADAAPAKAAPEELLAALAPGGVLLLDDLTPIAHWPLAWRGRRDPLRDFWLNEPRVVATELLLTPTTAALLATRR